MANTQWSELIEDWQACEVVKVSQQQSNADIKTLQQKTRKRARKMKCFMWADIITTILAVVVFAYLLTTDINLQQSMIFSGVMIILVPLGIYSVLVRRGLWQANGNDTQAYLQLAKERALAGIKLANANIIAAVVILPFITAIIGWRGYLEYQTVTWPFNVYVFGMLFELLLMIAMIYGGNYYKNKKRAELNRLETMLADWTSD